MPAYSCCPEKVPLPTLAATHEPEIFPFLVSSCGAGNLPQFSWERMAACNIRETANGRARWRWPAIIFAKFDDCSIGLIHPLELQSISDDPDS